MACGGHGAGEEETALQVVPTVGGGAEDRRGFLRRETVGGLQRVIDWRRRRAQ